MVQVTGVIDLLASVAAWLSDPAHWGGEDGIPTRVFEHLQLSGAAVAIAACLALPVGLYLGHTGRGGFVAINIANLGRALPSLALIALGLVVSIALGLGLGFWPILFALVPLAVEARSAATSWTGSRSRSTTVSWPVRSSSRFSPS